MSHVRKLQLLVLRPMLTDFGRAHDEVISNEHGLNGRLNEIERRLDETLRRMDRLTEETAAANALAWDQMALSRRLAALEDRLAADTTAPDA